MDHHTIISYFIILVYLVTVQPGKPPTRLIHASVYGAVQNDDRMTATSLSTIVIPAYKKKSYRYIGKERHILLLS